MVNAINPTPRSKSASPPPTPNLPYVNMLLAIDPGSDSGWALFFENLLLACGLGQEPNITIPLDALYVERPVVYPGGRTKNPNDLIAVALSAGEWVGRFGCTASKVIYVKPRTWKGTLDGDVCNERVLGRLTPDEMVVYDDATRGVAKGKRHNVLDAIGIGLYASGRFGR